MPANSSFQVLNPYTLVFAIDSNGTRCELAKRSPPVLSAFEDKPAFVSPKLDKRKIAQFLIVCERDVPANDGAPMPLGNGVVKF